MAETRNTTQYRGTQVDQQQHSTSSPEYHALLSCFPETLEYIEGDVANLSDSLFSKRLLTESVFESIIDHSSNKHAARRVLFTVLSLVKQNASNYQKFLNILEQRGYSSIVSKLKDSYEAHLSVCTHTDDTNHNAREASNFDQVPSNEAFSATMSVSAEQTLISTDSHSFIDSSAIVDHDNSLSQNTDSENQVLFTKGNLIDLEARLICESRQIIMAFANFTLNVRRSLEYLEIPLMKIKDTILSLEAFTDGIGIKILDKNDEQAIKAAKSLSEVFMILRSYISFFNFHIIEQIIHQHGATRDHTWLNEYREKFDHFCKRSIFEVPQDAFVSSPRKTAKVFVLKCSEGVATMKGVEEVRDNVAKMLGLLSSALQLCSIKKGCVELHFLISAAVADHIFPVSPSKQLALSKIQVKVLSCEKVKHTIDGDLP